MTKSKRRLVPAFALSAALAGAGPALADVTVNNNLSDTGIRVLVYNSADLVRLAYCAQIDIGTPSTSRTFSKADASGCQNYSSLYLQIRTFRDNYPYASMGTNCEVNLVGWNSTVNVNFKQEYQLDCR